jgi:hypothetical protein
VCVCVCVCVCVYHAGALCVKSCHPYYCRTKSQLIFILFLPPLAYCSVLRSLFCPIHHSLPTAHLFIPTHTYPLSADGRSSPHKRPSSPGWLACYKSGARVVCVCVCVCVGACAAFINLINHTISCSSLRYGKKKSLVKVRLSTTPTRLCGYE